MRDGEALGARPGAWRRRDLGGSAHDPGAHGAGGAPPAGHGAGTRRACGGLDGTGRQALATGGSGHSGAGAASPGGPDSRPDQPMARRPRAASDRSRRHPGP
jgi:hypothetical protein